MTCVIQRVTASSVSVDGRITGSVGHGLNILFGVKKGDTRAMAEQLAEKIVRMRIFTDEAGKMNLSLEDIGGEVLIISQFTLLGNTSKGRRPSFENAEEPEKAKELYEYFFSLFREKGITAETGVFGADMKVEIHNDGPVTFILTDTDRR